MCGEKNITKVIPQNEYTLLKLGILFIGNHLTTTYRAGLILPSLTNTS